MKERPNRAELEKRIDFAVLPGRLGQVTERDNPQRKTVFAPPDHGRAQMLAADPMRQALHVNEGGRILCRTDKAFSTVCVNSQIGRTYENGESGGTAA